MAKDEYRGTEHICKPKDWFASQVDSVNALEFYPHISKIAVLKKFILDKCGEHDVGKIYTNCNDAVALVCRTDILHDQYKLKLLDAGYVVVVRYKTGRPDIFWFEPEVFHGFFDIVSSPQ